MTNRVNEFAKLNERSDISTVQYILTGTAKTSMFQDDIIMIIFNIQYRPNYRNKLSRQLFEITSQIHFLKR